MCVYRCQQKERREYFEKMRYHMIISSGRNHTLDRSILYSSFQMMSKMQLLDLPNELLFFIFQYLKSSDLVQAFSEMRSSRIQALIHPFLHHLDISEETNQWVEIYLPQLFLRQTIIALRVQDKHLDFIAKDAFSSDLQTMHILSSDWATDLLKQGIDFLRRRLKRLSITFTYPHGKGDIASQLFQSDSQLEYLHVAGRFLYFDKHEIDTSIRLTHLSIELEGMQRVFLLLNHLPKLQELKVNETHRCFMLYNDLILVLGEISK